MEIFASETVLYSECMSAIVFSFGYYDSIAFFFYGKKVSFVACFKSTDTIRTEGQISWNSVITILLFIAVIYTCFYQKLLSINYGFIAIDANNVHNTN